MKKWWIMVGIVMAAVVILAVCLYGLPIKPPTIYPSGTGNSQLGTAGTTLPPETTEETLPWEFFINGPISHIFESEMMEMSGDVAVQVLPGTVDNSDGLPVLKWVCMVDSLMYPGDKPMNEAAVVEFNQMLADKNLPYRVQFTVLSTSGYFVWPEEWFSHPDVLKELEDADLIFGYCTAREMEQWMAPLTDHIYGNAQPTLAGAMPDPLNWYSYEANGEIYGIPYCVYPAYGQGWSVEPEFMEKYDLTAEDFSGNFWEMDELFAEIYEKNGNQPFIASSLDGGSYCVDMNRTQNWMVIGNAFNDSTFQKACLTLTFDLQAEKLTVVNFLETDVFHNVYEAILRYEEAGYFMRYSEGNLEGSDDVRFGVRIDSTEPYLNTSYNEYYIPYGPLGLTVQSHFWLTGISAKSAHAEEALSLLEQIMVDDALRLQLCYGKEGRDYILEDGAYTRVTQEDGSWYCMEHLSPQAALIDFTTGKQSEELAEAQRKNVSQASFAYCPIVFDYSGLEEELTAIGVVLGDYYPMYSPVQYDMYYEEYYPEMLEKLEEAGMSTVIAEMQRQLDAWIAEHPDWNPLERS